MQSESKAFQPSAVTFKLHKLCPPNSISLTAKQEKKIGNKVKRVSVARLLSSPSPFYAHSMEEYTPDGKSIFKMICVFTLNIIVIISTANVEAT